MSPPALPPPKFTRPRLHDALARERLFIALDRARAGPMVWISGPPGAGKTTLVGSYVEARSLAGLWYQVDAGDVDLSTFFYFLGEAVRKERTEQPSLPLLTPEYQGDVAGFSRRWFRQLFSRVDAPALLVFDNVQEAAPSQLDVVLASALAEVPAGSNIVVISREDPPLSLARPLAHGELAVLGWHELRFTLDEAREVAAARGVSAPNTVRAVFDQCTGWAAGLTLMLEQARTFARGESAGARDSLDTVFSYFAGLVFEGLCEQARRDLVLCSYLPSVTRTQAELLTGNRDVSRLLDQLYRRHLFVTRRLHAEPVYEFHALFGAFLRTRAFLRFGDDERRQAISAAARVLAEARQDTEAVTLLAQIRDWDAIVDTVHARAPALLAQGRGQTVRDWIGALPRERLDAEPMIRYWLGSALASVDQARARAILSDAYEHLRALDDFAGQVAAASGVVETYFFSFSGYGSLREWTERLAGLLALRGRFSTESQRLDACGSYLLAAFFGDGTHPDVSSYVGEIRAAIRSPLDPMLRFRTGTFLVAFAGATLNPELVSDELELLDGLSRLPSASPLRVAQWQHRFATMCYQSGDFETALHRVSLGRRLCDQYGLRAPMSLLRQLEVMVLVAMGRPMDAMRLIDDWQATLSPDRPVERGQWSVAQLMVLMGSGERREEWAGMAESVAAQMDATGQTWIRVANRIPGAYALSECGELAAARRWVCDLRLLIEGTCFTRFERDILLIEGNIAWHEGRADEARSKVRAALQRSREGGVPLHVARNVQVHSRLLSLLRGDVEYGAFAAAMAAKYGLNNANAADLPTPIRVLFLGACEIAIDGMPLQFARRQQHRPLSLLKVLVAQGGSVSSSFLAESLWPDADGDDAANALKVALHRLRKLLGADDAIESRHGALSLSPAMVWTDVAEFERLLDQANRHRSEGRMDTFAEVGGRAIALYRGPLLPADEPRPWLVAARDRLARKARQLSLVLGAHLEATRADDGAATLYESGLEIDPLSEPLYQRLMGIRLRAGQPVAAMQVFRRCREILSVVLGVSPSAETLALFRQAQAQARGNAGEEVDP